MGGDTCIGLSCLLIRDQKTAPSPYLFRYLQHISVLPATGTISHPLTPGWRAGSWGDPSCLFVDRLLNCLEKRWYCWHLLHLCEVQVAHTPYVMAFCTAWRKHLYDWKNWMGEHFFAVYSIWITAAMGKLHESKRLYDGFFPKLFGTTWKLFPIFVVFTKGYVHVKWSLGSIHLVIFAPKVWN